MELEPTLDSLDDTGQDLASKQANQPSTTEGFSNAGGSLANDNIGDGLHTCGVMSPDSSGDCEPVMSLDSQCDSKNLPRVIVRIPSEDDVLNTSGKISPGDKEIPKVNLNTVPESSLFMVEHDDVECFEASGDLEPLLTVDDSESQSSDFLSLGTVSYDIVPQFGGDEDDGTISSDIKLDSSYRCSKISSSSSLVNLLETSCRETSVADEGGTVSSASSCLSSPSDYSPIIGSSDVKECLTEMSDFNCTIDTSSVKTQKLFLEPEAISRNLSSMALDIVEQCISNALNEVLRLKTSPSVQNISAVNDSNCHSIIEPDTRFSSPTSSSMLIEEYPKPESLLSDYVSLLPDVAESTDSLKEAIKVDEIPNGTPCAPETLTLLSYENEADVTESADSLNETVKINEISCSSPCGPESLLLLTPDNEVDVAESADSFNENVKINEISCETSCGPEALPLVSHQILVTGNEGHVPRASTVPKVNKTPMNPQDSSIKTSTHSQYSKALLCSKLSEHLPSHTLPRPSMDISQKDSISNNSTVISDASVAEITDIIWCEATKIVPSPSSDKEKNCHTRNNSCSTLPTEDTEENINIAGTIVEDVNLKENFELCKFFDSLTNESQKDAIDNKYHGIADGDTNTECVCVPSESLTTDIAIDKIKNIESSCSIPSASTHSLEKDSEESQMLSADPHSVLEELSHGSDLQDTCSDVHLNTRPSHSFNSELFELWVKSFIDEILATAALRVKSSCSSQGIICQYNPKRTEALRIASSLVEEILNLAILHVNHDLKMLCQGHEEKVLALNNNLELTNHTSQECAIVDLNSCKESSVSHHHRSSDIQICLGDQTFNSESVAKEVHGNQAPNKTNVCNQLISHVDGVVKGCELPHTPLDEPLIQTDFKSLENNVGLEKTDTEPQDEDQDSSSCGSKSTSPECVTSDSARGSLNSTADSVAQREVTLFIDGILEMAVKRYADETSSSSESSPIRRGRPEFEIEFSPQEDEELATPCGEMMTEHFMDFESGRNVSVFCSTDDRSFSTTEHLSTLDRVVNTIGNREVDSDTGKSVSVFRSEEDIFYEIQRGSTCTSVFESVEEEDEDMVDTTAGDKSFSNIKKSSVENIKDFENNFVDAVKAQTDKDTDAFEDAVDAFLEKERLARDELKNIAASPQVEELDSHSGALVVVGRNELRRRQEMDLKHFEEVLCQSVQHGQPESELSSTEEKRLMAERWANGVPDTPEMHEKQRAIRETLDSKNNVASKLCKLALTEGGLIDDALRKEAWPRMLGLDPTSEICAPSLEDLKSHPEYEQVVLDVNRSLKRFPPDIPRDQRETLQDKLTRLIMFVISKHPHLRYYQGYHDVAVTFLLVVGEAAAFQIMERLSTEHLSDCMQPTMERTSYLLHFIYPLLHRLHPALAEYLERSEVGTMFCLPWFLTWFGHSLNRYQDVVRLYDHFLASPPLAPLYLAAVLVAHRADEVLAVDCDMAAIHALLSNIPDTLPLEILLRDATDLYQKYPPESIEQEVEERFKNEQDSRLHEMEARDRARQQRALQRRHGSGSWQLVQLQERASPAIMLFNRWIPPWVVQQQRLSMRLLFASATFFVGFYVYARGDVFP